MRMSIISIDLSHISLVGGMLTSLLIGPSGPVISISIFFSLPGSGIRIPLSSGTSPLLAIFISEPLFSRVFGIDRLTSLSSSLFLGH